MHCELDRRRGFDHQSPDDRRHLGAREIRGCGKRLPCCRGEHMPPNSAPLYSTEYSSSAVVTARSRSSTVAARSPKRAGSASTRLFRKVNAVRTQGAGVPQAAGDAGRWQKNYHRPAAQAKRLTEQQVSLHFKDRITLEDDHGHVVWVGDVRAPQRSRRPPVRIRSFQINDSSQGCVRIAFRRPRAHDQRTRGASRGPSRGARLCVNDVGPLNRSTFVDRCTEGPSDERL